MTYNNPDRGGRSIEITPEMINPWSVGLMDIVRKGYLLPAALLILTFTGDDTRMQIYGAGALLAVGVYCYFYSLCGKRKPWWLAFAVGAITAILLWSPVWEVYSGIWVKFYPGEPDPGSSNIGFVSLASQLFFGVGLREEIFKSLAVFLVYFIGINASDEAGKHLRIIEPVDAILVAIASGLGFAFTETIFQYAPEAAKSVSHQCIQMGLTGENARKIGALVAFKVIFQRSVQQIAGHAAYSGYLGYFMGLGALKPRKRWYLFTIGLVSAAALHACWDAATSPEEYAVIGIISYAGLIAAILQARRISPTRSENFATEAHYSSRASIGRAIAQPLPNPAPRRNPAAEWTLHAISGALAGQTFTVAGSLTLGRDPAQCDVVLAADGAKVSRRHCTLTVQGRDLLLQDCGSSNGTYLATGEQLSRGQSRQMQDRDRFFLGSRSVAFEIRRRAF